MNAEGAERAHLARAFDAFGNQSRTGVADQRGQASDDPPCAVVPIDPPAQAGIELDPVDQAGGDHVEVGRTGSEVIQGDGDTGAAQAFESRPGPVQVDRAFVFHQFQHQPGRCNLPAAGKVQHPLGESAGVQRIRMNVDPDSRVVSQQGHLVQRRVQHLEIEGGTLRGVACPNGVHQWLFVGRAEQAFDPGRRVIRAQRDDRLKRQPRTLAPGRKLHRRADLGQITAVGNGLNRGKCGAHDLNNILQIKICQVFFKSSICRREDRYAMLLRSFISENPTMALRWIEIVTPSDQMDAVRERVENAEVHDWWMVGEADRPVLRVVLERKRVEGLLDDLEPLCGDKGEGGVRVMVGSVDAMMPEPDVDEAQGGNGDDEDADRLSRFELVDRVGREARLDRQYLFMVALSSIVAAVGLVRGNVAVVVGAMVIAPLLAPNVALALAATLGDLKLGATAVRTGMTGVVLAVLLGFGLGWLLPVDPTVPEIASRTSVDELDLVLALAAGAAGALAVTSGVSGALVGVMVAVALLPPLLVVALLAGAGEWRGAFGALLLYSTNVASVNLAGIAVFLSRGITPRTWWEKRRAARAAWWAMGFWVVTLAALVAGLVLYNRS